MRSHARPHARTTARLLLALALAPLALVLSACDVLDARVNSPFSGKPVTESELIRERIAIEDKAKADLEASTKAAQAEIRKAQVKARLDTVSVQTRLNITGQQAQQELAAIEAETGLRLADATAQAEAAAKAFEASLASIEDRAAIAFAEIDAKRQQASSILTSVSKIPVVGQAAAAVGLSPDGLLASLGGVLGVGGVGYHTLRVRGERKKGERETEKKAAQVKADRDEHDVTWDEAQAAAMRNMLPLLMAAMGGRLNVAQLEQTIAPTPPAPPKEAQG